MTQSILIQNRKVVPWRTCRPLTLAEINSKPEQDMQDSFDIEIQKKLGDSIKIVPQTPPKPGEDNDFDMSENEEPLLIPEVDPIDATRWPVYEQPLTDMLLQAEVLLPQGEEMKLAKVIALNKDDNGGIIGSYNENPLLNSIIFDMEFPDGEIKEYAVVAIYYLILS